MDTPHTLQQAIIFFADADRCFEYAVNLRWQDGVITCPRCGSDRNSFVQTRKLWHCKGCRKQFTIKVGTVMEDSPIGLDKWMGAMWMLANCKNGVSSYEIHRALGITQKTAWFLLHRIRTAMNDTTGKIGGNGPVEMDETFVGGKVKNMHKSKRPIGPGASGKPVGSTAKTIVVGMVERGGRVKAGVVLDRTNQTLDALTKANVADGATLITDEWSGYHGTAYEHAVINHAVEYVNGHIHTNGIENFWSCLKRGLNGTYISVEPAHLDAYVVEQVYRYNNRKDSNDRKRFEGVMAAVAGKRLTYSGLTGAATSH
jgi:transposase-like protein